MTITLHLPTEEEKAQVRMGLRPASIEEVAAVINRNRNREMYGCAEGTIKLIIPRS